MKKYTADDVNAGYDFRLTDAAAQRVADLINAAVKEAVEAEREAIAGDMQKSISGMGSFDENGRLAVASWAAKIRARGVKE